MTIAISNLVRHTQIQQETIVLIHMIHSLRECYVKITLTTKCFRDLTGSLCFSSQSLCFTNILGFGPNCSHSQYYYCIMQIQYPSLIKKIIQYTVKNALEYLVFLYQKALCHCLDFCCFKILHALTQVLEVVQNCGLGILICFPYNLTCSLVSFGEYTQPKSP